MDGFGQYEGLLRDLDLARQTWASHFSIADQVAKVCEAFRSDALARSLSTAELLKQMRPTLPKLDFLAAGKLSLPDLKLFDAHRSLTNQVMESFRNLALPCSRIAEMLAEQHTSTMASIRDSLTFKFSDTIQAAVLTQTTGLKSLLESTNFSTMLLQESLAASMLRPQMIFADFLKQTTKEIKAASGEAVASALRATVNLTQVQLYDADLLLAKVLDSTEVAPSTDVFQPTALVVPDSQKKEIVAAGPIQDEEDLEAVTQLSQAAQISGLARRVLRLVHDCNEAAQLAMGGLTIFRPTNRILGVYSQLPWILPCDRVSFGEAVDGLFYLLYEGAGDDKLRFIAPEKGLFKPEECDAIFGIKFLRNKWLRHDPEHGDESKIRKSFESVEQIFGRLGVKGLPTTDAHFRLLYWKMLEETESFLRLLLDRLNKIMERG